jgi:ATP-binding cassette subfamily B protein
MDHGRVMERGTHRELLDAGGYYRQLYDAQFAGQEEFQAQIDMATSGVSQPAPATA